MILKMIPTVPRLLCFIFFLTASLMAHAKTSYFLDTKELDGEIKGSHQVCLNRPYSYTMEAEETDFIYVWSVNNGKIIGRNTGSDIEVIFTDFPAKLVVVKEFYNKDDTRSHKPVFLDLLPISVEPQIKNVDSLETFYSSSQTQFRIDLGSVVPDFMIWSIEGSGKQSNFGNIIDGINEPTVRVSFNEISSTPHGILKLEMFICDDVVVARFPIRLKPRPKKSFVKEKCSKEHEIDTSFLLASFDYSTEQAACLQVPNFNPDYEYTWFFNGTQYKAEEATTCVQFSREGNFVVQLRVQLPCGCSFETPIAKRPVLSIMTSSMDLGHIEPFDSEFCIGHGVPLRYIPTPFSAIKRVIWMRGHEVVSTEHSFLPTQSGVYWPILVDANGCKDYALIRSPKTYLLMTAPYVRIDGKTTVDQNEKIELQGITTTDDVEFYWSGSQVPLSYTTWTSDASHKTISIDPLEVGVHEFNFHIRQRTSPYCVNTATTVVTVTPDGAK